MSDHFQVFISGERGGAILTKAASFDVFPEAAAATPGAMKVRDDFSRGFN